MRADASSPDHYFETLDAHPEWGEPEQDALFEQLVARFEARALGASVRARLGALARPSGALVLRLAAAIDDAGLYQALAEALLQQTTLPPERDWEALELLQDAAVLEAYAPLVERWHELEESLAAAPPLEELIAQIEQEPEGLWLALEGLGPIEPEVRAEILAGFAGRPLGPGSIAFLRLLGFCCEPRTRAAALGVLAQLPPSSPGAQDAWAAIAAAHSEREVVATAVRWLGPSAEASIAAWSKRCARAPRLAQCLVTAVDGAGQADIVLEAQQDDRWAAAAFRCDVERGVCDVLGELAPRRDTTSLLVEEVLARSDRLCLQGDCSVALRLLAGSLAISGSQAPPSLRFWLEQTAGPAFCPHALALPQFDAETDGRETLADSSEAVLDACPGWLEGSPLVYELAEEIALRERSGPDPRRDESIFRYLFAHAFGDRLDRYRLMLLWMCALWQAASHVDLAQHAFALACSLAEGPNATHTHPFFEALAVRSLTRAQGNLRQGIDPRKDSAQACT